jgi:hypothetical protein
VDVDRTRGRDPAAPRVARRRAAREGRGSPVPSIGAGALACALALAFPCRAQGAPPERPDFERVDHAHPEKYVALLPSLGDEKTIRQAAKGLRKPDAEETLAAVDAWISANLAYDEKAAYAWRDFGAMCRDKTYGGCADHAVAFGALARACGIPTVWVKTMDADWIREFRSDPDGFSGSWRGHVFLEVHVDGRWKLLDASTATIHDDYDVRSHLLPGDRWAYDKGGDPHALVLSPRWEEWKEQTRAHFRAFDLSLLPVRKGRPVAGRGDAYVAADNPGWEWIAQRCAEQNVKVATSGNQDSALDAWVPRARGAVLIVAWVADRHVIPARHRRFLPSDANEVAAWLREKPTVLRTGDIDGTRVILVCARTPADLKRLVDETRFDELVR